MLVSWITVQGQLVGPGAGALGGQPAHVHQGSTSTGLPKARALLRPSDGNVEEPSPPVALLKTLQSLSTHHTIATSTATRPLMVPGLSSFCTCSADMMSFIPLS